MLLVKKVSREVQNNGSVGIHHKKKVGKGGEEGRRKIWDKKGPREILNMSCRSFRGCDCCGLQAAAYSGHTHANIKQKYSD